MENHKKETFNAFVTKYALTQGIFEIEGFISKSSEDILCDKNDKHGFYFSNDWHKTEDEAIKKAEEMRVKKLKSLDRQIKKVSSIKFNIKRIKTELK